MGQGVLKHLTQVVLTIFPVPTELRQETNLPQGGLIMSMSPIYRVGRLHEYVWILQLP